MTVFSLIRIILRNLKNQSWKLFSFPSTPKPYRVYGPPDWMGLNLETFPSITAAWNNTLINYSKCRHNRLSMQAEVRAKESPLMWGEYVSVLCAEFLKWDPWEQGLNQRWGLKAGLCHTSTMGSSPSRPPAWAPEKASCNTGKPGAWGFRILYVALTKDSHVSTFWVSRRHCISWGQLTLIKHSHVLSLEPKFWDVQEGISNLLSKSSME
jgi:hypothetical protein